jgi:ABC-type multidrug transport system permease subunit
MENLPAIEVLSLHKAFGENRAVQGVSFEVGQGEIFSLLGPNGAGKTTTISMLSCLLRPDDGDARIMGHSIRSDGNGVKSALGVVPQDIALYEDLTARENLSFWGKMYGLCGSALKKRVDEVLDIIGLRERANERMPFHYAFEKTLDAWTDPPIAVTKTKSPAVAKVSDSGAALAHTAPGTILQFAIAGLLTAAQIIVTKRKTRTLQRLLTTSTRRIDVALGHFLAIFLLLFTQFTILIVFGQVILKVDYFRVPEATALVAVSAALCISALGLLIGFAAKSEEQAITFSLIPMFVFSGLSGAWVPLEVTGATFRAIGHISPVAWGIDGFENIVARGLGFESVLLPSAALLGYALLFFSLAVWRLYASEEKQNSDLTHQNICSKIFLSGRWAERSFCPPFLFVTESEPMSPSPTNDLPKLAAPA